LNPQFVKNSGHQINDLSNDIFKEIHGSLNDFFYKKSTEKQLFIDQLFTENLLFVERVESSILLLA